MIIPHDNGEALPGKRYSEVPDFGIYADSLWTEEEKGYAAMITILDTEIGILLKRLDDLGLAGNTLVIFTSDNGADSPGRFESLSNAPLRGKKRSLYEGGIRVPFIARWPGKILPGRVSPHVSAFWDIMPVLCDAAGIDPPEGIDGISFYPELLGKKQQVHDYLYWEFFWWAGKSRALRMGKWKAVQNDLHDENDAGFELYDFNDDVSETRDLSGDYPEIAAEMLKKMRAARTDHPVWPAFDEH